MDDDSEFPVPTERVEAFLRTFYAGPDLGAGVLDTIIDNARHNGVWENAARALQYVGCWAHDAGGLCPCYRNGLNDSHEDDCGMRYDVTETNRCAHGDHEWPPPQSGGPWITGDGIWHRWDGRWVHADVVPGTPLNVATNEPLRPS